MFRISVINFVRCWYTWEGENKVRKGTGQYSEIESRSLPTILLWWNLSVLIPTGERVTMTWQALFNTKYVVKCIDKVDVYPLGIFLLGKDINCIQLRFFIINYSDGNYSLIYINVWSLDEVQKSSSLLLACLHKLFLSINGLHTCMSWYNEDRWPYF